MDSVSSPSVSSSRGSTPRRAKTTLKICYGCQERKTRDQFPKRQWETKNRRCFSCFAGSVPFSYEPKGFTPLKGNILEERFEAAADEPPAEISYQIPGHTQETRRMENGQHASRKSTPTADRRIRPAPQKETRSSPDQITESAVSTAREGEKGRNRIPLRKKADEPPSPANPPLDNRDVKSGIPSPQRVADPAPGLDDDIENLARNWTPENQVDVMRDSDSAAQSNEEGGESEEALEPGRSCCMRCLLLFASPIVDEAGSCKSVTAGLLTLFLIGSTIGAVAKKNTYLPTLWYQYVSAMLGYVYFVCWSISFYPQVISNFNRKSTQGLSADFCALNVLGFACYTAYNVSLFWDESIREQYRERFDSDVTVQSNDVAFAIHALVLSSITLAQVIYYRGSEKPFKIILVVIVAILLFCAAFPVLILQYRLYTWLDYLYLLSFVKIGISLIKYIPQVILNYRRRSTEGWSIWNILLDFTGGVLSDLQLVFDCADMGDFSGITGNLAKFGLGFVSILFDIIFMTQHYILYSNSSGAGRDSSESRRPETEPLLSEEERREEAGDETN